ncbi:MAG: iron-containing alcohol dehydrogenase [Thermoleophilia bacterium]|nr:iron-containing alcohol dehydrogenase [Thermoleophilia bacterium]
MNPLFVKDPLRSFGIKQTVFQGSGCLAKIPYILAREKWKRVLLVIGPHVEKTSTGEKVKELLEIAHAEYAVFSAIKPDPLISDIEQIGIPLAKEFRPDAILAVGGGSTLDSAKGIALVGESEHTIEELMGDLRKVDPFVPMLHKTYPMIAVPTTFGTGSEVIRNAVVTNKNGRKIVLMHDCILPAYALCDPDLAATLPAHVAAAAAMDALVQAVEAYVSLAANDFSETMSLRAVEHMGPHIVPYYRDRSDPVHADAVCKAAMYGGIAWNNSFVAQIHASNHPVTELLGIPHGEACAILFPAFVEYNGEACREKFWKVYNLMYPEEPLAQEEFEPAHLVAKLIQLNRDLGILGGKTLADYGCTEETIDQIVATFPDDLYTYPRPTSKQDMKEIYLRVMRGDYQ